MPLKKVTHDQSLTTEERAAANRLDPILSSDVAVSLEFSSKTFFNLNLTIFLIGDFLLIHSVSCLCK